jgi:hypothetical protein
MFYVRSVKSGYKERVKLRIVRYGGANTSTVTLRVVGGGEKGSLKCGTVKYGRKSQGTRIRETLRWEVSAAYIKDRTVFSSERAPDKNKTVTVKQLVMGLRLGSTARLID